MLTNARTRDALKYAFSYAYALPSSSLFLCKRFRAEPGRRRRPGGRPARPAAGPAARL